LYKEAFAMIRNDRRNGLRDPRSMGKDGTIGPMFFRGFLGETRGVWFDGYAYPETQTAEYMAPETVEAPCVREERTCEPIAQVPPIIETTT
jgi:hypothetical protein